MNAKLCFLLFNIILLSARWSNAYLVADPNLAEPPEHKPAVLRFMEFLWRIALSPFMLFFASLDYATEMGERSADSLAGWYNRHFVKPTTEAPESNDIPVFVQATVAPQKENILQRIKYWIQSKRNGTFENHQNNNGDVILANTSDWQYPSDLSNENNQDGLTWFLSRKKLDEEVLNKTVDQTSVNSTVRPRSKFAAAARRGWQKVRDSLQRFKEKERFVYDWVMWKLMAIHSVLPTFGKGNYTNKRNASNLNEGLGQLNMTKSFICDDIPSPVCAVDETLGYTIFLNPCRMSLFNYNHHANFTIFSTDVCMGLFIRDPNRFYQSKKEQNK
uniref:Kazal-like domain-containing protein n=1 Tax=Clastoptera arizonana TaxID=38151 RepID=A0A1B6CAM9_9HEMI